MNDLSITHQRFCDFIQVFRKDKSPLPKWKSYPLYALSMMSIGIFIAMIKMSSLGYERIPRHPSNYRMVMKINWLGFKSYEFRQSPSSARIKSPSREAWGKQVD